MLFPYFLPKSRAVALYFLRRAELSQRVQRRAGRRAERMVGATAWKEVGPDPPWLVVDRSGVGHYVADEDALIMLGRSAGVRPADIKQLVGRGTHTSSGFLPQYRGQMQLLGKLRWIQRVDDETQIIYVSGDAKFFCAQHAPKREDTTPS